MNHFFWIKTTFTGDRYIKLFIPWRKTHVSGCFIQFGLQRRTKIHYDDPYHSLFDPIEILKLLRVCLNKRINRFIKIAQCRRGSLRGIILCKLKIIDNLCQNLLNREIKRTSKKLSIQFLPWVSYRIHLYVWGLVVRSIGHSYKTSI